MNFVGVNEMILNAETVKLALEQWINSKRIVDELEILSIRQRRSGAVYVRFVSRKEMARKVGVRASASCTLKAGPAEVVPIAGNVPAGAREPDKATGEQS